MVIWNIIIYFKKLFYVVSNYKMYFFSQKLHALKKNFITISRKRVLNITALQGIIFYILLGNTIYAKVKLYKNNFFI
jgi:hypothetical protein